MSEPTGSIPVLHVAEPLASDTDVQAGSNAVPLTVNETVPVGVPLVPVGAVKAAERVTA